MFKGRYVDARDGFEPSLTASKAAVLPLDDLALPSKYHKTPTNSNLTNGL